MTLEAMKKEEEEGEEEKDVFFFCFFLPFLSRPRKVLFKGQMAHGVTTLFFFQSSSYNPGATPAPCGEVCKKIFIKHSDIIDFFSSEEVENGAERRVERVTLLFHVRIPIMS